ncbi:MAG: glycoside hydrolase family 97 catalytic domain-containing protein [Prevotella sp.]
MKKTIIMLTAAMAFVAASAKDVKITSPDGKLVVLVTDNGGKASYSVTLDGRQMVTASALGLKTNIGDFSKGLTIVETKQKQVEKDYKMTRTKTSGSQYVANQAIIGMTNAEGYRMDVTMNVSNNDVAFRYTLPRGKDDNPKCAVIYSEASSFNFPQQTTTFICPQSKTMVGWERTKPSYEEEYKADAAMTDKSAFGEGYTLPCLYRIGDGGWVLIGETGVGSNYAASHLSDYSVENGYSIAFPNPTELSGMGSPYASIALPGSTPWRTVTIGETLKPIVETTIPYDLVEPLYEPSTDYKPGRYTWSWLMWQDTSINYDDQVKFIDLAAEMGFEYTLVDNWWDTQIGRDRMRELSEYAQGKGVKLMLWYNSNGHWNDAPQGPRDCMNTSYARQREMRWMKEIGIAGIKVDFFGSDKQEMMKLYEDILVDANNYGLQVVFHGCTIPRGWERMYPNYVASEALLASENVRFSDYHAKQEGFQLTMHPFCRNALGTADWGGVMMNRYMSQDNKSGHPRYTSDIFEIASAIVIQTSVNCVAMCPNNLDEMPQFELDFLKQLPTTWDETRFVDGYPTKFVVLARRIGEQWYVAGLNGTNEPMTLTLDLPMFAGKTVNLYTDNPRKKGEIVPTSILKTLKVDKDGKAKVTIQGMGGIIIN